jgi:hypothetical protein
MVGWVKVVSDSVIIFLISDVSARKFRIRSRYCKKKKERNYKIKVKEMREISLFANVRNSVPRRIYLQLINQVDCWSTNHFTRDAKVYAIQELRNQMEGNTFILFIG